MPFKQNCVENSKSIEVSLECEACAEYTTVEGRDTPTLSQLAYPVSSRSLRLAYKQKVETMA